MADKTTNPSSTKTTGIGVTLGAGIGAGITIGTARKEIATPPCEQDK